MTPLRFTTPSFTVIEEPSRGTHTTFASSAWICSRISSSLGISPDCFSRTNASARNGFVKFTLSTPVRVVPQAHIVRVSDGQSHVNFPLRLFNLTTLVIPRQVNKL